MGNSNTEHSRKLRQKTATAYNKKNIKQINCFLNKKKDIDLIEAIEKIENKNGLIKELLREYFSKKT